jgi:hypothetical protein
MKRFRLKREYITDVRTEKPIKFVTLEGEVIHGTSIGNEDHPEFTKLREKLGSEGYISIERGWWNGDRVLKPFYLNGKKFDKGEKFCSASAMGLKFKLHK